jgi:hypothetical protein
MHIRHPRRTVAVTLALTASGFAGLAIAQSATGGFEGFWGPRYTPLPASSAGARSPVTGPATTAAADAITFTGGSQQPLPFDPRSRLVYWNRVAIDASGVDHTPVTPGENRIFGEQLGPGRSSRAMAIVHIAIFDAVNSIANELPRYTGLEPAPAGASLDAAIAQAAHDTLTSLFPSQASAFRSVLTADLARISESGRDAGVDVGRRAAAAILAMRKNDGSERPDPRLGIEFIPLSGPGKWRQDPVSKIPIALGAYWGQVKPFVIESGKAFRVPPPPELTSRAYARAFDEVKRVGGDGTTTPTERTIDQTSTGTYWAYDGMPSLCAPPRLYNQIAMTIADQMGTDFFNLTTLLALVNVAMADTGIATWESKYYYQLWRPVTGVREADSGTGPTGVGDDNPNTAGDPTFLPLGAPTSNLSGPAFTPPFPSYPSGHAGFGGALFEVLRQFYGTDQIPFTFTSDEYNGVTLGADGLPRALHPRHFDSLSQAEDENGQSRIYLGIHWSFDKTQGIAQGRRVARSILRQALGARKVQF